MDITSPWPRRLLIAGLVVTIAGALDPMEGSIVILAGIAALAIAAHLGRSSHRRLLVAALVLAAVGITALWGLSAVGGFGGRTGRTTLWWFALVPYPIGWVMAVAGGIRAWRDGFPGSASGPVDIARSRP